MKTLTPELLNELRSEARKFAEQIGVRRCDDDCDRCWMYRSDVPCAQRDIVDACILGAKLILNKMGENSPKNGAKS